MNLREKNNLWRSVGSILEWTYGLTNIQYGLAKQSLARVTHEEVTHYPFDIQTDIHRLSGLKHPLGLVIEDIHMAMTGVCDALPDNRMEFRSLDVIPISNSGMMLMELQQDNGGYSTIGVQVKMQRFDGGQDVLSRQFLFRNNFLHAIQ